MMETIEVSAGAMYHHPPAWSPDVRRSGDMADDTANPLNVPYGYCHCGCGQKTKIATRTRATRNIYKGEPHPCGSSPTRLDSTPTSTWGWN